MKIFKNDYVFNLTISLVIFFTSYLSTFSRSLFYSNLALGFMFACILLYGSITIEKYKTNASVWVYPRNLAISYFFILNLIFWLSSWLPSAPSKGNGLLTGWSPSIDTTIFFQFIIITVISIIIFIYSLLISIIYKMFFK